MNILTQWLVLNCQLGDPQKAQDAVQNTFEVVSKSIRKIKDPGCFAKWVYQILQNKGIDIIRQKQRQDMLCEEFMQFQDVHAAGQPRLDDGPEDFYFEQMLSGLEQQLYQLVHLHYLEGFSMLEISDLLTIPTGTIKSRLHQARKLIQNSQIRETL